MKNIVIIEGSPRKGGNTEILAEAFSAGAQSAGHTVTKIFAAGKHIKGCTGCNCCYKSESHRCALDDDMTECYEILKNADVIVAATPVYFYGISSQLKCLVDRLHNPIRNSFKVKKLVLLSVAADTLPSVFDSVTAMYESILSYFSLEDGGRVTVYGVADKGDILCRDELKKAEQLGKNI